MKSPAPILPLPPYNDYKIIILVEDGLAKRIIDIRSQMMEKYSIENPATSIPQLILANFRQVESAEERLINRLRIIAKGNGPIIIKFKDYGCYTAHTIYINIINGEILQTFVKKLKQDAQRLMKSAVDQRPGFMSDPHLTILRRLSALQFKKAWTDYRDKHFTGKFIAHRILLVRRRASERTYLPIELFELENLPVEIRQGILF